MISILRRTLLFWPISIGALALLLGIFIPAAAHASAFVQASAFSISLSRDWGYGGPAGRIEGLFSFHVKAPEDVTVVRFFIDDVAIGEDTEPPFRYQFRTGNFALGPHRLSAIARTAAGAELTSNAINVTFVPAEEGWKTAATIAGPILALVVVIPVVMWLIERRTGRRRKSGYGWQGGAICPKCGKPFGLHAWSPNLLTRKFDYCPHCGKWSVVGRASAAELAAAEALWAEPAPATPAPTPAQTLHKRLDDSRYEE